MRVVKVLKQNAWKNQINICFAIDFACIVLQIDPFDVHNRTTDFHK